MIKKYFLVKSSVLLFLFLSCLFFGQTNTWTGKFDSNWNNAGNWSSGQIPSAVHDVVIPEGTITVDGNSICKSLTFTGTSATLTVNSGVVLTVAEAITLNSIDSKNSEANLEGSGTINTTAVTVGTQDNIKSDGIYTSKLNSTISNLNITGNINILTNAQNKNRRNDAAFYLQSGVLKLKGIIETKNTSDNISTFSMASGSQSGILLLGNVDSFKLSQTGTNVIVLNGANSTVNYNGADQNVHNTAYNNLIFSGSGVKSTSNTTSVAGNLSISNGVKASVADGTINAGSLTLGVYKKIDGKWGSTSSAATYKDNGFFELTKGIVNVTNDTRPTPVFSNLTASQSICFGTPTTTLSGTVSGGGVYPLPNETVYVKINGVTQNATVTGNAGAFTVTFNTATLPSNATPYIITYAFANATTNVNFKAATDTGTTILVNKTPVGGGVYSGNTPICLNGSTGNMTLGGGYVGTVLRWEKR